MGNKDANVFSWDKMSNLLDVKLEQKLDEKLDEKLVEVMKKEDFLAFKDELKNEMSALHTELADVKAKMLICGMKTTN